MHTLVEPSSWHIGKNKSVQASGKMFGQERTWPRVLQTAQSRMNSPIPPLFVNLFWYSDGCLAIMGMTQGECRDMVTCWKKQKQAVIQSSGRLLTCFCKLSNVARYQERIKFPANSATAIFDYVFYFAAVAKVPNVNTWNVQDGLKTHKINMLWSFMVIQRVIEKILTLKVRRVFLCPPNIYRVAQKKR